MIYPRVAVCGLVRDAMHRILLLQRGPDAINGAGEWSIPGGKLDPCETMAHGAGRELFEETGVEAREMIDTGVYTEDMDWGEPLHFVTHYFQAITWRGPARIVEPHKHSAIMWLPDQQLVAHAAVPSASFPLFAPTRRFVQLGGLDRLRD